MFLTVAIVLVVLWALDRLHFTQLADLFTCS